MMSDILNNEVELAKTGNIDAMGKLFSKTLKNSYFLAMQFTNDEEKAVEIVKKAYARVFCTIPKLKKADAFEIWMKQNISAVYKESERFTFSDAEGGADEGLMEFLPADLLDDRAGMIKISAAVKNLSPEKRTALILLYNNGMPSQAIAVFFGVSQSTVNALLSKAKEEIVENCGFGGNIEQATDKLPVMTRVFNAFEEQTNVPSERVREIFTYAIDIFKSFKKEADIVETKQAENEKSEFTDIDSEGSIEDPRKIFDDIPTPPEFKSRMAEITESVSNSREEELESSDVIGVPQPPQKEESFNFEQFTPADNEDEYEPQPVKKGFDIRAIIFSIINNEKIRNLDFKKVGILAAIALVVIFAIVGIAKGSSGKNQKQAEEVNYEWRAGGFEDCSEITYLDENCCVFKYAVNGKYGLLDYKGNILLQPNYEEFVTCSEGRDRGTAGTYHTKVKMGDEYYQFSVENGSVVIVQIPHNAHSVNETPLPDGVSYDERDRYFEGYAAARKKGKWGYVSQETDKKVIPYEYDAVNQLEAYDAISSDYCRPVTGGLIAVKKDGYMGIINLENEIVVPFEYSDILIGSDGVFIAKKDGVWGVILVGDAISTFAGVNLQIQTAPVDANGVAGTGEMYRVLNSVNVRSDAGGDFTKLGALEAGQEIEVLATKAAANGKEWGCIQYDNGYGYVIMSNLKKIDKEGN